MSHPDDVAYDDEPLPAQPARPELTPTEIREEAEAEHAAHNAGHPEFEQTGTPEGPCCRLGSDEALARLKDEDRQARFISLAEIREIGQPKLDPCPWCSKGEPHPTLGPWGAPAPTDEQVFDGVDALRYMLAGMRRPSGLVAIGMMPSQVFGVEPEPSDEPAHSVPGGRVRTFAVPSTKLSMLGGGFGAQGGFVLVVDRLTDAGLTHEVEHAWMAHGQAMGALTTIISAGEIELPGVRPRR